MRNYFLTASRWEAGSSETYQKGYGTRQKNPESAFCIGKCFAVWCPDPSSATEAASCNGNGAAWPKDTPNTGLPVPLFLEFLWEAQSRFWKKKSYSSSASLQFESMLQPHTSNPGLVVCFSMAAARWISLPYYWHLECSQPRKELSHKAWGSSTAHRRDDGAQELTAITAKGVLPL